MTATSFIVAAAARFLHYNHHSVTFQSQRVASYNGHSFMLSQFSSEAYHDWTKYTANTTNNNSKSYIGVSTGASFSTNATPTESHPQKKRPIALFLNCSRLDYDQKLDFSRLEALTEYQRHNVDSMMMTTTTTTTTTTPHDNIEKRMVQLVNEIQPEIIITKEIQVPTAAIQKFPPSIKLLCEAGTGYNNLPLDICRQREIVVCNVPNYSTDAVAQTAITYIMNFSISMFEQQRMLHSSNNSQDRSNFTGPFTLPLMELNGKTLGLIGGSGRIGSKVADIALVLGMNIIISSRFGSLPTNHRLYNHPQVFVTNDTNFLLQQSDFVSIHTPLNAETQNTFGRLQIEQMKPTAYLINTSRGKVCKEEELIECMKEGRIAGAGLDVTASEPPPMDSDIWTLPNIWLSPHIGWRRFETRQRLVDMTCDNIQAYIDADGDTSKYINVVSAD